MVSSTQHSCRPGVLPPYAHGLLTAAGPPVDEDALSVFADVAHKSSSSSSSSTGSMMSGA